jgi:O-acetyl-ADP-ribose deacetylase
VDVIVNAANEHLGGGGGVDGAIHSAGGPAILADVTRRYGPVGVRRCPTGSAVISDAGDLPARRVVHTVGPIWWGGTAGEPAALASAYRSSLRLADEHGAQHVAFPSISTGIFGYPPYQAAEIAVTALAAGLRETAAVRLVTLVAYWLDALEPLEAALTRAAER